MLAYGCNFCLVLQYYFPMNNGSGVKLTVVKYLTPDHYDISRRGGLEPDKECHDYPQAGGALSDKCIEEALEMLADKDTPDHAPSPARMPYHWLPLTERRFWATGSYCYCTEEICIVDFQLDCSVQ